MQKLKDYTGITLFIILLLYTSGQSLYLYYKAQKEINRHISNEKELNGKIAYYQDKSGREVARTKTLEYTVSEFKQVFPELQLQLKNLMIKADRVEAYSETHVTQEKYIKEVLHDTIIKVNNVPTPAKALNYRDAWYNISGIIQGDTQTLNISSTDTIIQVVSRAERLKPWLWFFSQRQLVQSIRMSNPENHVTYNRYIKIKK